MPILKKNVKVGQHYACRVSDYVVAVKITSAHHFGKGWNAVNLATRKEVRVMTAARLRWELTEEEARSFGKQLPTIAEMRHKMAMTVATIKDPIKPDAVPVASFATDDEGDYD